MSENQSIRRLRTGTAFSTTVQPGNLARLNTGTCFKKKSRYI
ncbi:MAG TPA: hypothetical protein VIM75_11810 [Ohtaekwangia sp.]